MTKCNKKKFSLTIIFILFSVVVFPDSPDLKGPLTVNPKSVLMVGNSFLYFNNGMHNPVRNLIKADPSFQEDYQYRKITISGGSLTWHNIKSYITNPFMGSFTFDKDNNLVKQEKKQFDLAIMHDCSRCPITEGTKPMFHKVIDVHAKTLKKADIEPALLMTWAYKNKSSMTKKLAKEYIDAANRNNILVIPVGLAFAKVNKDFPDIDLYTKDKRHPSRAGTYLGACVIFSSLYKKSPEGNTFFFGLDAQEAKNLQRAAWQITSNFYNGK